ncbi:MAG: LamG-like jellyroll fold domain-containing protein [Planctomycetota bacterium]
MTCLRLLFLLSLLLVASHVRAADPIADGLETEWGTRSYQTVQLQLPAEADKVRVSVPMRGSAYELQLTRYSMRAAGLQASVYGAGGQTVAMPLPAPRTYRGIVTHLPDAVVVASFSDHGLRAAVHADSVATVRIEPARRFIATAPRGQHVVFTPGRVQFQCGVAAATTNAVQGSGAQPFGGVAPNLCGMTRCEIAFDCDFEYFTQQGGTVLQTTDRVEALLNDVDFYYNRDLMVTYLLTGVVVRSVAFYSDISGGDLLNQFRAEWNANQTAITRDVGHLMTNKSNLSGYGGLAWVGVVCTNSMYGWSLDSAGIIGHEVGHNWGAGHCLDTSPCNNMCGACLSIGPRTLDVKRAHMASRTCLDSLPAHPTALPPFAKLDELFLDEMQIVSGVGFAIDVLDNDHDGNCDPILVSAVDATSAKGGTVVISAGTGTGGFDQVIYTPPTTGFAGNDSFDYTISDGVLMSTARVAVNVQRQQLAGHWRLDETTGSIAANETVASGPGTLVGGVDFATDSVAAVYGGGLQLDGVDDVVEVSAPNLNTNRVTITAWVRRSGPQNQWAGLVFCRGGSTVAGLNLGTGNELRYHWDGGQWSWNSGLALPDAQWTFVALVVTPNAGRIYMQPGPGAPMQVAMNSTAHAVEAFDGTLRIGQDSSNSTRFFGGAVDDVRIYSYSMTAAQVAQVAAGGAADAPAPQQLDNSAPRHPVLSWSPGFTVAQHDVYFGTDAATVAAATRTSPEYRGRHGADALHPMPLLPAQTTYTWQVDTVLGDGTVLDGEPWTFTTGSDGYEQGLLVHYTFDVADTIGTLVLDQSPPPLRHGLLMNGPVFVAGQVAGGVDLDGIDDMVETNPFVLNTNTLTISAWVRRDGAQTGTNGIVFWRGGSTTTGLNLGSHHELRYHWDGGQWGWDSGLEIPDGEWCHVALVIEPTQATIYRNGTSVVRGATHLPEAFDTDLVIGRDPGFGNRDFGGAIDEVAIWSRALAPGEVLGLYAAGRVQRPIQGDSDVVPPTPNPLQWDLAPTALGGNSFEMRAVTASDPSAVEYSFQCTSGPGNDSGWQQSPYYVDTGLPGSATCTYIALARDMSPNLNVGGATAPVTVSLGTLFIRGDANIDGTVNVADPIAILTYLFNGSVTRCLEANDVNDSGSLDIADAVSALTFLFGGGSMPPPFPQCGIDSTGVPLGCTNNGACP